MMMKITYFSLRRKTIRLVQSTAPNQELKLMSRVETENGLTSGGSH